MIVPPSNYQKFSLNNDGEFVFIGARMEKKLAAIPLPDLRGKYVLDIGCDSGFWSYYAIKQGAKATLGLDRNREEDGKPLELIKSNREIAKYAGFDRCFFAEMDLGKQWVSGSRADVVFLFSLYHHIFENCGDHLSIWYWLSQQIKTGGVLLWENPVDERDAVVKANVSEENRKNYTREKIFAAASRYFDAEPVGPAIHEPYREVWRFTAKPIPERVISAHVIAGAGGATAAFNYDDGRRIKEIEHVLGFKPYPGSLNLVIAETEPNFDWESDYLRAEILDVKDRSQGLDSEWEKRWARFYPLKINGVSAHALRFESEKYPLNFVELIAPGRLRDRINTATVTLCR